MKEKTTETKSTAEIPEESHIQKELEEQKRLASGYLEHIMRLQAEFENYQKRVDRERDEFVKYSSEKLITELLNVIDDFERAISALKKGGADTNGIEMMHSNFMKILEKEGLRRIECVGKKFDPYYHEAVSQEETDKDDGIIVEELQKGYMLNSKVIRHSKVKIAKKK